MRSLEGDILPSRCVVTGETMKSLEEEHHMAEARRHIDPLLAMTLGGATGGLTGFALWLTTEAFVFLPVLLAIGLVTGMAIAESRRKR